METIFIRSYSAPCGVLTLGGLGDRLCLCDWEEGRHREATLRRTLRLLGAVLREGPCGVTDMAARRLDDYFAGRRRLFNVPLLLAGTDFQQRVWQELMRIPYGTTITYGEQARRLGCPSAVRAVAGANGANPVSVIVPCHRVVGSTGRLTGYGGGLEVKRWLIGMEGLSPHRLQNPPEREWREKRYHELR